MKTNSHSIKYLDPTAIKPRGRCWRTYPPKQIAEAKRQLERTGAVIEPPLLDSEDRAVCGGAIVQAAQLLKWKEIPVLRVANMSPDELRLYAINAHKLSDMGAYDEVMLAEELRELERLLGENSLQGLALEEGELTRLLGLAEVISGEDPEIMAVREDVPTISRSGELWSIGRHRLLDGNALEAASFVTLMGGEQAQFGLTDPPYNIPMSTISSDPTREEFAFAHGEMSPNEFTRFLSTPMRLMQASSEPGSLHAFFMSYHYLLELLRAGTTVFGRPKAMCTWVKSQPGQGSLFRAQTEQIVYFRNGAAPHRNNVQLGKNGRNRTTAWQYDGMTTRSPDRDELLEDHATPKPVLMLKDAILDVTGRGGIVLDPFGGIGSTMLAAHSAERRAYLIEIESRYVDVAIRRMWATHGIGAVRLSDGRSFQDLEAEAEVALRGTRDD